MKKTQEVERRLNFWCANSLSRSETRGDSSLLFERCISSHARGMAWWESRVPVSISISLWISSAKVVRKVFLTGRG